MAKKQFWHELPQSEVDEIKRKNVHQKVIDQKYKKPVWCKDRFALNKVIGCTALLSGKTEINEHYCKECVSFRIINKN